MYIQKCRHLLYANNVKRVSRRIGNIFIEKVEIINKRKIYPGPIDVHPTENAIIVHYVAQAALLGENGVPVAGDKKECQKV